jgi:nitrate/nitrite-specific signal transduction histidine kinase
MISAQVGEHLLAVIREAVTNIGRHAYATEAAYLSASRTVSAFFRSSIMAVGSTLPRQEKEDSALST